jgi:hypothetical protein
VRCNVIVLSFELWNAESVNGRGDLIQRNSRFPDTLFAVPLMSGFCVCVYGGAGPYPL